MSDDTKQTTDPAVAEPAAASPLAVIPPADTKPGVTAAQAKVDAIAQLTMSAYQRAAMLELTPEESAALQERFPDEAFKPGAAGKENLIYIEHAFLRDRLNRVLGLGQWSLIPRNRWAEEFEYSPRGGGRAKGTRIYVEAMLVVRGAFVAEAVGDMDYYPNQATNYGDAVEGAKTAALRRCCKEFGIGLQAWEKDFCDGWWQRRRQKPQSGHSAPNNQESTPQRTVSRPQAPTETPEERKRRWLAKCLEAGGGKRDYATEFYRECDAIALNEELMDLPDDRLPKTKAEADAVLASIRARAGVQEPKTPRAASQQELAPEPSDEDEAWRSYTVPFGKHSGIPLGELDKKALFGFWANFEVEEEYNGKPRSQERIEADQEFRDMLDEAGEHYQFTKQD